jgi:RNA polymerase sigma factor (sigma-70 family)
LNAKHENSLTDQELIEKVLSGDTRAFTMIIKKTERLVAQIVFKMIRESEERRDIAQDVYLKVFKSLSSFKFQSKLSTWIAKITYNTCLKHLEKHKQQFFSYGNPETDDEGTHSGNKAIMQSDDDVESSIFQDERSAILKVEIEMLPALYRTLITLYHNEELSYSEIAQITELPEGTVKNYLFRARKTLRENLVQKFKRESL